MLYRERQRQRQRERQRQRNRQGGDLTSTWSDLKRNASSLYNRMVGNTTTNATATTSYPTEVMPTSTAPTSFTRPPLNRSSALTFSSPTQVYNGGISRRRNRRGGMGVAANAASLSGGKSRRRGRKTRRHRTR